MEDQPGRYSLTGSDGAGGIWQFDGLKTGKYSLSISYANTPEDAARIQALPAKHAIDPQAAPFWIGKARTKPLAIEITDQRSAAAEPQRQEAKALNKDQVIAKARQWLTQAQGKELSRQPAFQFSKEDLAKAPIIVAKDGANWRVVFANSRGNKVAIWTDAQGNMVKVQLADPGVPVRRTVTAGI